MSTQDPKDDFILRVLEPPTFETPGGIESPGAAVLLRETLRNSNIFASRKNWMTLTNLVTLALTAVPAWFMFTQYFSWSNLLMAALYSAIGLNVFSTVYFHRFCAHKAFRVENRFTSFIVRHLALRLFVEETFVVAHAVHHKYSDTENDPHNAKAGFVYTFLNDFTRMRTNRSLSERDYKKAHKLMNHMKIRLNTYEEYQRWGTITHPLSTLGDYVFNWSFWFGLFYLLGGWELVCVFGTSGFFWGIFVRNFNYKSHGSGIDKRKAGRDFEERSLSLNLFLPGILAGEWHNNHHLYPMSSRNGFLPYQLDMAFGVIRVLNAVGVVSSYIDKKNDFHRKYTSKQASIEEVLYEHQVSNLT